MSTPWNHDDFLRHALELRKRGVSEALANELRWCGNPALVLEVENASDADVAALNAAFTARLAS